MHPVDPLPKPERAPSGEPVVAFFDMDLTLLTVNSAALWLQFERREGRISRKQWMQALGWMVQYRLGLLDLGLVTEKALALAAGQGTFAVAERTERWYQEMVRPRISRQAVARLEAHRAAGHVVALLTASTQYGAAPLARELEIAHVVSTILEVRNGALTGQVESPLCYGEGKLARARQFADQLGADLSKAWFYTDSYTDRPVLEAVGHPVVVNPDPRLARLARRVGWPVVRFA